MTRSELVAALGNDRKRRPKLQAQSIIRLLCKPDLSDVKMTRPLERSLETAAPIDGGGRRAAGSFSDWDPKGYANLQIDVLALDQIESRPEQLQVAEAEPTHLPSGDQSDHTAMFTRSRNGNWGTPEPRNRQPKS